MVMRRTRLLASALAALLLLSSCGQSSSTATADSAAGDVAETVGVVSTVAGGQLDLASIEGQDTVLWFWAPW
jgi:ABC-type glycerol-3-phosphate transport system substrate-binding protein